MPDPSDRPSKGSLVHASPDPDQRERIGIPVVVLGTGVTALGVVRTLGRAGITAYLVSQHRDFAYYSRWTSALPGAASPLVEPDHLPTLLASLPLPRAVLMPCADDWTKVVASLPASLRERFPASIASSEVIEVLVDKGRFAELLERERLPHPRTFILDSPGKLEELSDRDLQGMFLKPCGSLEFSKRYGVKALHFKDRAEATRILCDAQRNGTTVMLQEYIPGPATGHHFLDGFVDRTGRICALFGRRRLRMHPQDFGNSSLTESIPLTELEDAVGTLRRLWMSLPYRGIFSAEFKRDPRDGLFKVLEINARPWWYLEFAARSGVDVCHLAYRDALGLRVEPVRSYKAGRRCVYLYLDTKVYGSLLRQGRLGLWSWLGSWIGADQPVFSWADPLPQVHILFKSFRDRLRTRSQPRPQSNPGSQTGPEQPQHFTTASKSGMARLFTSVLRFMRDR